MTTLLIACARRVPILRNRTWRSRASGMRMRTSSSSSRRAVVRYAGQKSSAGTVRSPRGGAEHHLGAAGQQDRQRVAGRRGVDDVAADRAAVLDLRRADRRGRLGEGRQELGDDRRLADLGVGRQRADHERVASTAIPRSSSRPQMSRTRSGGSPISPVTCTIRSVPPATGRHGGPAPRRGARRPPPGGSGTRTAARRRSASARSARAAEVAEDPEQQPERRAPPGSAAPASAPA